MNQYRKTLLLLAVVLLAVTTAKADGLRVFGPGSMRAIEQEQAGSSFLVAVWATDCPPCRRELALLSTFLTEHPDISVVLISTDPSDNTEVVEQILNTHVLPGVDLWRFGDAGAERLRYAIDTGWRGELPRSYLYDAHGNRLGISGPLSDDLLQRWMVAKAK